MSNPIDPQHPLRQLFSGLIEHAFQVEVGICDPALTDYLTELLADFVHVDRIWWIRTVDGNLIRDVSRFEAEVDLGPEVPQNQRQRLVNKYIGDFTLFWTGVYPENLRPKQQGGVDRLTEYMLQGKRSYSIASELSHEHDHPPAAVLQQLSEQFEYCVHGLHVVRAGWEELSELRDTN